jgi:hypothetical protein
VLKAHVHREAERLASTAVNAALDPEADSLRAGSLALRLIETADPPAQTTLEVSADLRPEDVRNLSYRELLAVAEAYNLTPLEPSETPPEGCHELPRPAAEG